MAIRKRGKGRWQVRVKGFPEVTLPTKDAAETFELDLKLRKKLGHLYQEKPTTVGAELDGYLERKKTMGGKRGPLRPNGVRHYEKAVNAWTPLRDMLVPALRRRQVEDRVAARAAVAPTSARNELEVLKAALRIALSRGQTVDPGIFDIDPVRLQPARGVALEYEQLLELASWMPDRIKRIVPFCGTVGLRFNEAATLVDEHVDLDAGEILIPESVNKSRKDKPVPLAPFEVQLLREQLMIRPAGTSVVFATEAGGVYTRSGFQSVWLPALLKAGLAERDPKTRELTREFKFHWLRHTAISLMAKEGMAPELIAERVGHADGGALIFKRYRHLFASELRHAVAGLEGIATKDAAIRRADADA